MKKFSVCFLSGLACISILTGCLGQSEQVERPEPEPISAEMLAQDVYDALQEEWDSYDSLSPGQKCCPVTCLEHFTRTLVIG